MITCHLTYRIDSRQVPAFEAYAKAWITLVARFGGVHHGYFLPSEGPSDLAFAAFSFSTLAAYEHYRKSSADDPECRRVYEDAAEAGFILRYDRHFLRPVLNGMSRAEVTPIEDLR